MMPPDGEVDRSYQSDVGARLRAVRNHRRISLQTLAANSNGEFKASVLGAYERGQRAISLPRLQRLAWLYRVPVNRLLSSDGEESSPEGQMRSGVRIDLGRLADAVAPEAAALQRYVGSIQVERGDLDDKVLTIRASDLRVIGAMFGLSVEALITRLKELGLVAIG